MITTLTQEPPSRSKQPKPPSVSGTQPDPSFGSEHVSKINEAFARLQSGKARYRIVLDADY